jgi:hypothetical protein
MGIRLGDGSFWGEHVRWSALHHQGASRHAWKVADCVSKWHVWATSYLFRVNYYWLREYYRAGPNHCDSHHREGKGMWTLCTIWWDSIYDISHSHSLIQLARPEACSIRRTWKHVIFAYLSNICMCPPRKIVPAGSTVPSENIVLLSTQFKGTWKHICLYSIM